MPEDNESKPGQQSFVATPSTRALALVSVAIIVGLFLVMIVNADGSNSSKKNANVKTTTTTTSTTSTVPVNDTTAKNTTTTTGKAISGAHAPANVKVLVLNGGNISGVAKKVSDEIAKSKYQMLTPSDDTSKDKGTIIYYKAGFTNDAKQLQTNVVPNILKTLKITQTIKVLQFPATAPTAWDQKNLVSANVVVVVGNAS